MLRRLVTDVAKHASSRALQQSTAVSSASFIGLQHQINAVSNPAQPAFSANMMYSTEFKNRLLNAPPASLASGRVIAEPYSGVEQNFFTKALLKLGGFYSKESRNLRGAKAWYNCVSEQIEDPRLYKAFGLQENFAQKYSMLCIHMWLLLVRLRSEGKSGKELAQLIHENFQEDVEFRVRAAGVKVRISKHLMDLEQMFFGGCLAYDKAVAGEEELSKAVLRNVYAGVPEKRKDAELLARYITRELACLALTPSEDVMNGSVDFSKRFLGK